MDFMTKDDYMNPTWRYARSGPHGDHNFRVGCDVFKAEFRYSGLDAGRDLVYIEFTRDHWLSWMTTKEIYNGRLVNRSNSITSRVVCQIILSSWCEYEPVILPVMREESRVLAIIRDNQRGIRNSDFFGDSP